MFSFLYACELIIRHSRHSVECDCAVVSSVISAYECAYKVPRVLENYTAFSECVQFGYVS